MYFNAYLFAKNVTVHKQKKKNLKIKIIYNNLLLNKTNVT